MRFLFGLGALAVTATAPVATLGDGSAVLPTIGETAAAAQTGGLSQAGYQAYLVELRRQAERAGVSRSTIERVFPTLTFSSRAVELDRQQPGGTAGGSATPPFAPYRDRHVTRSLIERGQARYRANYGRLAELGRRYGVQPSLLVAIWGKETSYGSITGDFDLLNALSSLAYEGRRRDLFAGEFVAALQMLDRGIPRSRLVGSWAGATGHPQFLPSVYLRVAADGDGDGRADIWGSEIDALASIANYLRNAGWRPNVPWGVAVNVPPGLDRGALSSRVRAPRCERVHERHSRWMRVSEWRRLGLVSQSGRWPADDEQATLLEPDGPGRTAYLLTNNYRTILDYNCSNFYALTVALLADAIGR